MPISRGKFKALVANPIPKVMASSQLQKRGIYFKEFIDDNDYVFKHFNIQAYLSTQGTQPQFPLALGGVSGVQPRDLDCKRPVRPLPRPQPPPLCTRPRFERNPSSCSCKYCSKCVRFLAHLCMWQAEADKELALSASPTTVVGQKVLALAKRR